MLLADTGHWNTVVNRLYYACFYAVSALLLTKGYSAAKNNGVRSLFNQHFVNAGLIPKQYAAHFDDLFEARQEADYRDFHQMDPLVIPDMISSTAAFLQLITHAVTNVNGDQS